MATTSADRRRINVRMTDELLDKAQEYADKNGHTMAWMVREGLADWLARQGVAVKKRHPDWGGNRSSD